MDFSWKIQGADGIVDRLSTLPDKMENRIAQRSARRAMVIVRNKARANAKRLDDKATPKRKIWRNVVVQRSKRQSKAVGGVYMRVGILGGSGIYSLTKHNVRKHRIEASGRNAKSYKTGGDEGNPGGDTWYWRFVELGIPSRGIAARPFLRNALESSIGEVQQTLITELTAGIDAEF